MQDSRNEAELAVVGAVLRDPDAFSLLDGKLLSPRYFTNPALQTIWGAILHLQPQSGVSGLPLVADHLGDKLNDVGGRAPAAV